MLGDDNTMGSGQVGCTDDRAQIMRIFDIIKNDNKGIFTLLFCSFEDVIYFCIVVRSTVCNYSLMLACFRELIKTLFFDKRNNGILME